MIPRFPDNRNTPCDARRGCDAGCCQLGYHWQGQSLPIWRVLDETSDSPPSAGSAMAADTRQISAHWRVRAPGGASPWRRRVSLSITCLTFVGPAALPMTSDLPDAWRVREGGVLVSSAPFIFLRLTTHLPSLQSTTPPEICSSTRLPTNLLDRQLRQLVSWKATAPSGLTSTALTTLFPRREQCGEGSRNKARIQLLLFVQELKSRNTNPRIRAVRLASSRRKLTPPAEQRATTQSLHKH